MRIIDAECTAAFSSRKLHVILVNLNTQKKNEDWLKAHPNVQFHFAPTSASWLNQVEVWFSILQGQSLSGTSFTSLKQLQEHINAYQRVQRQSRALRLDQENGPSTPFQGPPYHSALIPTPSVPILKLSYSLFVLADCPATDTFDRSENVIGGFSPSKRFGIGVPGFDVSVNRPFELRS